MSPRPVKAQEYAGICPFVHNGYCITNRRVCTPDIRQHRCPAAHGNDAIKPRGGTFVGFPFLPIDKAIEWKIRRQLRPWTREDAKRIASGIRKWWRGEPHGKLESWESRISRNIEEGNRNLVANLQAAGRYMRQTNKPEYKRPWTPSEADLIVAGIQWWWNRPVTGP